MPFSLSALRVCRFRLLFLFNHNYIVGMADCTQAVCHNNGGLPLQEFLQFRHDSTFIVCIQSIGGFIKENIMRFLVYSPGYKDTLLLPLTQPMPFLAYFVLYPIGNDSMYSSILAIRAAYLNNLVSICSTPGAIFPAIESEK